jgi:hypothetical protein
MNKLSTILTQVFGQSNASTAGSPTIKSGFTTMKFKDLISSANWLSVELTLLRLYPEQENMLEEYRTVFEKLQAMESVDNEMTIVLTTYDPDPDGDSDDETYVDVSGRENKPDRDGLTDSYAIEFVEWNKWLGMDLAPETSINFSDLEIVAHCLYEMTFVSFEEEEIQEQLKSLEKTVEELKNMTNEEKQKQTLSLEELLRQLEDKEGGNLNDPPHQ